MHDILDSKNILESLNTLLDDVNHVIWNRIKARRWLQELAILSNLLNNADDILNLFLLPV